MKKITEEIRKEAPVEHKKGTPPKYRNTIDRIINRKKRRLDTRTKYNNNRTPKSNGFLVMGIAWDDSGIHSPKKGKFKGWMRNLKS